MSENPDDEVSKLLFEWGLSDLKAKFKANYIVLQAFEYLTEEDIIELIPKIGQRAIFRGRLTKWRQQNGFASSPPMKLCKLESISDTKTEQEAANEDSPKQEAPTQELPKHDASAQEPLKQVSPKQESPKQEPIKPIKQEPLKQEPNELPTPSPSSQDEQMQETSIPSTQESPRKSLPKIKHKIYGTLTKCFPKGKAKCVEPKPAMQSKVKQFYISPPVLDTPSPVTPTPAPIKTLRRSILPKADLAPFVTSIIRVETKCEKSRTKTSPTAKDTKVNRTTILQRVNSSRRSKSAAPPTNTKDTGDTPDTQDTKEQNNEEEEELPEASPLYPIVKLETEPIEANWNEYPKFKLEPETEPEPDLEPEPELEQEPELDPVSDDALNREEDELLVESSGFQPECMETLDCDSLINFDSENDNSSYSLKRIAPEVFRPRKRKRKILMRLDIRNILMNSEMGQHVLNYYEANERLDLGRRRMLIDAIIQDCWVKNRRISPTNCKVIAEEIIEILPNERVEDYYVAQQGRNPKSPLYNKYRNMHKRFDLQKGSTVPVRKKKKKSHPPAKLETDDIEIDDDIIIS